jgi:hypothetical protein
MSPVLRPALAALLALAGPLACPAAAQGTKAASGTITGTIDLEQARWVLSAPEGARGSAWRDEGGTMEVRLVGRPEPGATRDSGRLVLSFTADAGVQAAEVQGARVVFDRDGQRYAAEGANVDLTLSAVEAEGQDIAVAGSFAARLAPGGATGELRIDAEGPTIDGNFQGTVPAARDG